MVDQANNYPEVLRLCLGCLRKEAGWWLRTSSADGRSNTLNRRCPGGTSESAVEDWLESGRGKDGDLGDSGVWSSLPADHSLDG